MTNSDEKPPQGQENQRGSASSPGHALSSPDSLVTLRTLGAFLCGSQSAALTVASCKDSFWLGFVLALSAGIAREYDRTDLLQQTWVVLIPMIGALIATLGLFPAVEVVAWYRGVRGGARSVRFQTLLSMFWLTAPLGWVFALPVERYLPADQATIVNLWFLAILSIWRILLFARLMSIVYVPRPNAAAFVGMVFVVLLVVDTLSVCLIGPAGFPMLVGTLGGTRPTGAEHLLLEIKFVVTIFQILSWPVWMVGTLAIAFWGDADWAWTPQSDNAPRLSRSVKVAAAASLLIWILILPLTQPPQQRRATPQLNQGTTNAPSSCNGRRCEDG